MGAAGRGPAAGGDRGNAWGAMRGGANVAKLKQTERVLRHLRDFGSLTALEAMSDYGIMHLASRIDELRKDGWPSRPCR